MLGLDTAVVLKRFEAASKRMDIPLAASSFCHLAAVAAKLKDMRDRLTLYVSDRSNQTGIPKGSKYLVISHPALGDEAMEVY